VVIGGLGLGSGFGKVRGFGGRAVVPVEGCCAVEKDGMEAAGGGVVRG